MSRGVSTAHKLIRKTCERLWTRRKPCAEPVAPANVSHQVRALAVHAKIRTGDRTLALWSRTYISAGGKFASHADPTNTKSIKNASARSQL
jgi:hypothetical protein